MKTEEKNFDKANSSHQKKMYSLEKRCTQLWLTNTLRKRQLTSWNKFFDKLLKEGRITKEELKANTITKEEALRSIPNKPKLA